MITRFILAFVVGLVIGFYGEKHAWDLLKTVAVALAANLVLQLIVGPPAQASEVSLAKLRSTAVHIDIGSGSIVEGSSGKKYLLTNSHVCMDSQYKNTMQGFYVNGEMVSGKIAKDNVSYDLCAARVRGDYPALRVAKDFDRKGTLCTLGYPRGILAQSCGTMGPDVLWNYTFNLYDIGECPRDAYKERSPYTGKVVGCTFSFTSSLTNLFGRPGSSGSPVVDEAGDLIGVVSDWQPDQEYETGLVTFSQLKSFMKGL